jgi:hypothetical protein
VGPFLIRKRIKEIRKISRNCLPASFFVFILPESILEPPTKERIKNKNYPAAL